MWIGDARLAITDLERTLLDGLSMPQCCGDFAEVLHTFEIGMTQLDVERISESWRRKSGPAARFEPIRLHTSQTGRIFGPGSLPSGIIEEQQSAFGVQHFRGRDAFASWIDETRILR